MIINNNDHTRKTLQTDKKNLVSLVVDDNHNDRQILCQQLTNLEITVIEAENAIQALEICQEYFDNNQNSTQPPFDVCFFDIIMPEMGGMPLAANFRKHKILKEIPVAFIISQAENDAPNFYIPMYSGMFAYLIKPINDHDLLQIINIIKRDK